MYGRENRKLQLVILLVLVSLVGTMSIAYAVLSTTLNITGTAQIQDASWNVHFDNIQVNPYSVEINPVITDSNKVTFSANLTTPGDFYKFTVDIVNDGSIDAMIDSIIKTPELTDEQKKYLKYEVEYVDGTFINESQSLKLGETKTISVLFSYRNDIPVSDLPDTESDFDLEIVLVYTQADSKTTEITGNNKIVKIINGDLNTAGSEICIEEECFYLMKNDGYNVTMLSKYNLYVGNYCTSSSFSSCLAYGDEATGKQDSTMRGWITFEEVRNGTKQFSSTGYWSNTANKYPNYVYNENSYLYEYIENYKKYLESFNITIANARLISYEELMDFGCIERSCVPSDSKWIYLTSYWTGTASTSENVWSLDRGGYLNDYKYDIVDRGVRPIVEIPLLEF